MASPPAAMKHLLWIALLASGFACSPASIPVLTPDQWRQDIAYFANQIATKHRDPYHFISKAKFDQAVADLSERVHSMISDSRP
jgi:hypothetical protein